MKLLSLLVLFLGAISLHAAEQKEDLINKLLPEDSLVRIIHNKEPRGTGWWGWDSPTRSACDGIQQALQKLDSTLRDGEKSGGLRSTVLLKSDPDDTGYELSIEEYFFRHLISREVYTIVDPDKLGKSFALVASELVKISDALSPQLARMKKLTQVYEEQLKAKRDAEKAKQLAAARTALLARYNK